MKMLCDYIPKILPLVYDESLSYYEVLCKVVEKINEIIADKVPTSITYADPIDWDITTQYTANTVVVDPKTGTAYISKEPVPTGILLTNDKYWMVIFNYNAIQEAIKYGIASNEGDNEYASKDYATNDLVWWGNNLYLVLKPITSGGQFKPNDNVIKIKIEDYLPSYDRDTETLYVLGKSGKKIDPKIILVDGHVYKDNTMYITRTEVNNG